MQATWAKPAKGQTKEDRIKEVLGYRNAFDALKEILEKEFKKKTSARDYEVPNWEFRQIAINEYNQVLDDVLRLITLVKE